MSGICSGRVVIVTGAGRGIGREHALELARQGARVVVNDLGVGREGQEPAETPADEVVAEIRAAGGEAVADASDVADWDGAGALVERAVSAFGQLDAVVNNAGFVRDRMFVSSTVEEWDAVMRVHLRGHFCVARHAVAHWRAVIKAGGSVSGRIVNTSSGAGVLGSVGQAAYSAAKGGIASLTLVQAAELGRYGIAANAICPIARTRMTEEVFGDMMRVPESGFDAMSAANVAPLVAWLCSEASGSVTGRVFEVSGDTVQLMDGWRHGVKVSAGGRRWDPSELTAALTGLLAEATAPEKVYGT
ncbi:MAG: SDR family NAD(P)-dependent oxidoreductase [Myxococcales bacterium]|nr:SDR family NAD(P)-dependent oxidoreductase [Myxococcales bacterium]MCB9532368.1 SDR family NAD(P)-dependent oxidoreductase [Myxococcales bacterium]